MIAAALAIGLGVVLYRGPGRAIVRGHVGDAAATLLVYGAIGLAGRGRIAARAALTLAIALAIELGQTAWHARSLAGELLVGGTFDPWDLVAYGAGVAAAVTWERAARARDRAPRGRPATP